MTNNRCFIYIVSLILSCFLYMITSEWYISRIYPGSLSELLERTDIANQFNESTENEANLLKAELFKFKTELKARNNVIRILHGDLRRQNELMLKIRHSNEPAKTAIKRLVFVTYVDVTKDQTKALRNFVGSVHREREAEFDEDLPLIIIYSKGAQFQHVQEFSFWYKTEHVRTEELIGVAVDLVDLGEKRTMNEDLLKSMMLVDACRKYGHAILVEPTVLFHKNHTRLLSYDLNEQNLAVSFEDGIAGTTISGPLYRFASDYIRRCSISSCERDGLRKKVLEFSFRPRGYYDTSDDEDKFLYYCFINIRDDFLYSNFVLEPRSPPPSKQVNGKRKIALGVPTTSSKLSNYTESRIIRSFIPSLLSSVTKDELDKFEFHIYVGFDSEDVFWDNTSALVDIRNIISSMLPEAGFVVHYVKIAYSHAWLTFIWNKLYSLSLQEGCDFFYQVNDDLVFNNSSWATSFTRYLDDHNGMGVAGPFDPAWNCSLLTQAMVSRRHWEIFGWFYPQDIKDWYSDLWITRVYQPEHFYCSSNYTAVNLKDKGSRYQICNQPKWSQAIARDKIILKRYLESKRA